MTGPGLHKPCTIDESGAFIQTLELPPTAAGVLDGLRFGVKDFMDIAGTVTGCGNPDWARTHSPAVAHAVCVEQVLAAGATCIGKTVSDELAFSLDGENHFYGTPLNPRAPDRVPGGSSSGSASAVACGLADFALGTDAGGSIRVPAANCGLFGLRPSHGIISLAGVMPFAPTYDTVGILAPSVEILTRVAAVLLAFEAPPETFPGTIHLVSEAFALVDPAVRQALSGPVQSLKNTFSGRVRETSPRDIDGEKGEGLENWFETFCTLQWGEIWSSLGAWIREVEPALGPRTKTNFELAKGLDRSLLQAAIVRREAYSRRLDVFLKPYDFLCLPTTPAPAPKKGTLGDDARYQTGAAYYPRALSLTAIAGIGRLPQVSLPVAEVDGAPVGLSLIGSWGQDALLLAAAGTIMAAA